MKIENYKESVNYILRKNISEIIASNDCLILIKLYSDMYLGGSQCRTCANSQRKYYERLKKDGMKQAEKMELVKIRTCVPAWDGIIYVSKASNHYNSKLITDDEANYLLSNGYLGNDMFNVIPQKSNIILETEEIKECISEIKEQLIAGVSKSKIKDRYKDVSNIGTEKCSQKLIIELIKKAELEINEAN